MKLIGSHIFSAFSGYFNENKIIYLKKCTEAIAYFEVFNSLMKSALDITATPDSRVFEEILKILKATKLTLESANVFDSFVLNETTMNNFASSYKDEPNVKSKMAKRLLEYELPLIDQADIASIVDVINGLKKLPVVFTGKEPLNTISNHVVSFANSSKAILENTSDFQIFGQLLATLVDMQTDISVTKVTSTVVSDKAAALLALARKLAEFPGMSEAVSSLAAKKILFSDEFNRVMGVSNAVVGIRENSGTALFLPLKKALLEKLSQADRDEITIQDSLNLLDAQKTLINKHVDLETLNNAVKSVASIDIKKFAERASVKLREFFQKVVSSLVELSHSSIKIRTGIAAVALANIKNYYGILMTIEACKAIDKKTWFEALNSKAIIENDVEPSINGDKELIFKCGSISIPERLAALDKVFVNLGEAVKLNGIAQEFVDEFFRIDKLLPEKTDNLTKQDYENAVAIANFNINEKYSKITYFSTYVAPRAKAVKVAHDGAHN